MLGPLERIRPLHFLWFTLLAIVATRAVLIAATPQYGELIDLTMYREVGQLVLNGIDPYDHDAQRERREQFRLDGQGGDAYVSQSQEQYDYFVSSNLPGSTLLFALFEWISGGSAVAWRAALVLGDLLIALAAYLFCVRAGVDMQRAQNKLGFFALVVVYPSLLMWGTLIPEDKQFQTAFLLFVAALLMPLPSRAQGSTNAAALGATLALSVLFKAFGVLLVPAVLRRLSTRPRREWLWFGVALLVVVVLIVAPFSTSFLPLIARRLHGGSIEQARHGSPWKLVPWPAVVSVLRPLVVLIGLGLIGLAYRARRIDLLNALAGILLTFICLWITNGSMDRLNITMIFACFCLAAVLPTRWWKLALASTGFQALTYVGSALLHGASSDGIETADAANTAFFVLGYYAVLVKPA